MKRKYEAIQCAFDYNNAKSLRLIKKQYKECLDFYNEYGEEEYKKEYPYDKSENILLNLKGGIKLINLYLRLLKEDD